MFGFGNKKKKIYEAFFGMVTPIMGSYTIMRALSSHRMEETGLGEQELKLFEAAYIFGVIDLIAHAVDVDEKTIRPEEILDMAISCTGSLSIFSNHDARTLFTKVRKNNVEGNSINNLMYLGAKDAESASNAILENQDSSNINRAMGLKYLDNKELIEHFIKDFDSSLNID